jgi:hypothetical protein
VVVNYSLLHWHRMGNWRYNCGNTTVVNHWYVFMNMGHKWVVFISLRGKSPLIEMMPIFLLPMVVVMMMAVMVVWHDNMKLFGRSSRVL